MPMSARVTLVGQPQGRRPGGPQGPGRSAGLAAQAEGKGLGVGVGEVALGDQGRSPPQKPLVEHVVGHHKQKRLAAHVREHGACRKDVGRMPSLPR